MQSPPGHKLGRPSPEMQARIEEFKKNLPKNSEDIKKYDGELWFETIRNPGSGVKKEILRRIFTTIRYGGLMIRHKQEDSEFWWPYCSIGWPIACTLSHGGRILIQLPRAFPGCTGPDHSYWNWLTCDAKVLMPRVGTHSTGNRKQPMPMVLDRVKVVDELKSVGFGISQGIRKLAESEVGPRSFGMNIALGGAGNTSPSTNMIISDNGDHGHVYFCYRPPLQNKYGAILIGVEGEAPGHWGQSGNFHSPNIGFIDKIMDWRSSSTEGLFTEKWKNEEMQLETHGKMLKGPGNYDCTVIDLTATGWDFLRHRITEWDDSYVKLRAELPMRIKPVEQKLHLWEYNRIPITSLQLRLDWLFNAFRNNSLNTNDDKLAANEDMVSLVLEIYKMALPKHLRFQLKKEEEEKIEELK